MHAGLLGREFACTALLKAAPKCSLSYTQTQKTLDYLKFFFSVLFPSQRFLRSLPDPGTSPGPSLHPNNEPFHE